MSHCTARSIPMYRNPALHPGLAALVAWLLEQRYSSHAIGRIESFVAVHGTLAGSMIEPEDEAEAEAVFVDALPAVPLDSDAWDRDQAVTFDAVMLAAGNHPWPTPAVGDDDRAAPSDFDAAMDSLEDLPAPVCGGAPRYEPTPEDWASLRAWSEDLDRRRDAADSPMWGYE
jgi:hypothetical protein